MSTLTEDMLLEIVEKPPKMKLRMAAEIYFARHPDQSQVGLLTKEGRVFYFRRNPSTGEPIKAASP